MAQTETNVFISLATSYLGNADQVKYYESGHIRKIISIIFGAIDKFEAQELGFTFTADYRIDLILEVAGYALKMFKVRQEEERKNHPSIYMETLKDTYLEMFKSLCNSVDQEQSAAICLASYVIGKFHSTLQDNVALTLVREMNNKREFSRKPVLNANILMKLLEKENFDYYRIYLTDISSCYLYWIREIMKEKCTSSLMRGLAIKAFDALVPKNG
jgi:hypothetical protein